MNRSQLIERVCAAHDVEYSWHPLQHHAMADFTIRTAFSEILKALKSGEVITIRDFGTWRIRTQSKRRRFNVNSREVHITAAREVVQFNLARSNPLAKIAADPFSMPTKFEAAEDLISWLATAARSIHTWEDEEKAIAAWKRTKGVRETMLSADQQRAIAAVVKKAIDDFDQRRTEEFRELAAVLDKLKQAKKNLRNARARSK